MSAEKYGDKYWCVKVSAALCKDREIYIFADRVEFTTFGGLIFHRERHGDKERDHMNLAFAPGIWSVVYAASCIDGHPVAVEHWTDEKINTADRPIDKRKKI